EAAARVDEYGRWRAVLEASRAGGAFDLVVHATQGESIRRTVWVGDLYLCSGQSNMQWTLADSLPTEEDVAEIATLEKVFVFLLPKAAADKPLADVAANW